MGTEKIKIANIMIFIYFIVLFCLIQFVLTEESIENDSPVDIEARTAMAKQMMLELKENMLRRKQESGELKTNVKTENDLSDLLDQATQNNQNEDSLTLVLFTREPLPLDMKSFKSNAEAMLRRRSEDKKVDDDFRRLSVDFDEQKNRLSFVRIDTSTVLGRSYAEEYNAKELPQLQLFVNGVFKKQFDGDLKLNELSSFVKKYLSKIKSFDNEQEAYDLLWNMKSESIVFGFFKSKESKEFQQFKLAVDELKGEFTFASLITDKSLEKLKNVPKDRDSIVIFRSFDVPAVVSKELVSNNSKFNELIEWIEENASNLVEQVDKLTFNVHVQRGRPLVVLWLDPKSEDLKNLLTILRKAALKFKGKLTFLFANGIVNRLQAIKFGVPDGQLPALTLLDMTAFTHYVHESKPITLNSIVELCQGYIDKTIEPNVRKQTPPSDGLTRIGVKQLVYDTFKSFVFDEEKDVLVAFCKPTVSACQILDGILDKVAKHFENKSNFQVALMDMSQNDEPRHSIRSAIYGYPTIKFFPAKDKKAIVFEAKRITTQGLIDFMEDKSVNYKPAPQPRPNMAELEKRLLGSQVDRVKDYQQKVADSILENKRTVHDEL